MPIAGLSDRRRLPRIAKIKTGILVQGAGGKSYPKAVDHFICSASDPALVERFHVLYGDKPKTLDIMFPVDDVERLFPQDYKAYKANGLACSGDGLRARRWGPKGMIDMKCPCDWLDRGECKPVATLHFMVPKLPGLGVWTWTTSSTHAIEGLNSELELFHRAFGGLRGVPFQLVLEAREVSRHVEGKGPQKTTIHVPRLKSERSLIEIVEHRRALGAVPDQMLMLGPAPEREDDDDPEPGDESGGEPRPVAPTTPPPARPGSSASLGGSHDLTREPAMPKMVGQVPGAGLLMDECFELAQRLDVDAATYRAYLTNVHGTVDLAHDDAATEIQRLKDAGKTPHTAGAAKAAMRARSRRDAQERLV